MQINVGQGPSLGMVPPGVTGIRLQPRTMHAAGPRVPRHEFGQQAGGGVRPPADSGTQTPGMVKTRNFKILRFKDK